MNCTCPSGDGSLHHPCPSHPTLADVQPGGTVRLGDALLPCPFCGNDAEFVPYKNNGLTLKCKSMGCIQRNQRTLRYGIDWLRTSMTEHWNARVLSARQPVGEPEIEFQARLMDVKTNLPTENWRHSPIYEENPGRGTHYWVEYRKRYIYYAPPAQAVDLEQFRPFVEAQRAEYISHGLTEEDYCVAECDELLALIDSNK